MYIKEMNRIFFFIEKKISKKKEHNPKKRTKMCHRN